MNGRRASLAIIRRQIDRAFGVEWLVRFAIFAAITAVFAPLYSPLAAFVLITNLAPLASVSEGRQLQGLRRVSFFAMPLYGRQLARAHAVAPALLSLAAPAGFLVALALRLHEFSPLLALVGILANVAGALIALSAVFRDGPRAWLYYALTVAAGFAIALPVYLHLPVAAAGSTAIALAISYLALRAFGETLARYDPLPA